LTSWLLLSNGSLSSVVDVRFSLFRDTSNLQVANSRRIQCPD
jgi:hypothetical protein